jgi:hypothetical protein
MISVASVDYCEQCKCKTLHVPMPSGDRVCEHHLTAPASSIAAIADSSSPQDRERGIASRHSADPFPPRIARNLDQ